MSTTTTFVSKRVAARAGEAIVAGVDTYMIPSVAIRLRHVADISCMAIQCGRSGSRARRRRARSYHGPVVSSTKLL